MMGGKTETLEALLRKIDLRAEGIQSPLLASPPGPPPGSLAIVTSPNHIHHDVIRRAAQVHAAIRSQSLAASSLQPRAAEATALTPSGSRLTSPAAAGRTISRQVGASPSASKFHALGSPPAAVKRPMTPSIIARSQPSTFDMKLVEMKNALRTKQQELNVLLGSHTQFGSPGGSEVVQALPRASVASDAIPSDLLFSSYVPKAAIMLQAPPPMAQPSHAPAPAPAHAERAPTPRAPATLRPSSPSAAPPAVFKQEVKQPHSRSPMELPDGSAPGGDSNPVAVFGPGQPSLGLQRLQALRAQKADAAAASLGLPSSSSSAAAGAPRLNAPALARSSSPGEIRAGSSASGRRPPSSSSLSGDSAGMRPPSATDSVSRRAYFGATAFSSTARTPGLSIPQPYPTPQPPLLRHSRLP
jgi:hypothetical protein